MFRSFLYGIFVGAVFMGYWFNWFSTDIRLSDRISDRYHHQLWEEDQKASAEEREI